MRAEKGNTYVEAAMAHSDHGSHACHPGSPILRGNPSRSTPPRELGGYTPSRSSKKSSREASRSHHRSRSHQDDADRSKVIEQEKNSKSRANACQSLFGDVSTLSGGEKLKSPEVMVTTSKKQHTSDCSKNLDVHCESSKGSMLGEESYFRHSRDDCTRSETKNHRESYKNGEHMSPAPEIIRAPSADHFDRHPVLIPNDSSKITSSQRKELNNSETLSVRTCMQSQREIEDEKVEPTVLTSCPVHSTSKDEEFTNDPHPALETPLLYFMLRRSPKLLKAILCFYNFRWDVSYPLQSRLPCKRVVTLGEIILLTPFVLLLIKAILYSTAFPSVKITGHEARTPLIFVYVSAMKNNFMTFFLGIPVERAIKYHKLAARLAYITSLLHTYVAFRYPNTEESSHNNFFKFLFLDTVNAGGTMLVLVMTAMIITSLPYFRRKLFELFYFVHVAYAVLAMVCAYFHTGSLLPLLGGFAWGLDLAVRKMYMPFFRYPRKASLKRISDTVLELSFPKQDGFDFNPGQYLYIAVPELGYLQWHPFSLSSSPKQKIVTLHIRKAGTWTSALYNIAKKQSHVDILIEGPYGSIGVDLTNTFRYQTVMLFSGGIGVTPMQSLCNSLMYEHNQGSRKLRKLTFVWIERDPVILPEVDVVRRKTSQHFEAKKESSGLEVTQNTTERRQFLSTVDSYGALALATELLTMIPPGKDTDEELARDYPSSEFDDYTTPESSQSRQHKRFSFSQLANRRSSWQAGDEQIADKAFFDEAFEEDTDVQESPIDLQIYLTQAGLSEEILHNMPPFVTTGRPEIKMLFQDARQDAMRHHQARVAVCVCAPQRIVDLCRTACANYSDRYVAFDLHSEVFD